MNMFEIGKTYRLKMLEGDEHSDSYYTVKRTDLPLLMVSQPGRSIVIKTPSTVFISAELDDPEAREAAHNAFFDSLVENEKNRLNSYEG